MHTVRTLMTVLLLIANWPPAELKGRAGERRSASPSSAAPVGQNTPDTYARLPLTFVPNAGQTDPRVRFTAQAGGASFFFTPGEAVFAFNGAEKGLTLRLAFVGANPAPQLTGARPGTGRVNYLIGRDPSRWRTGLAGYGEVVYGDLWPGIDLVFSAGNGGLKYEFHVAPGADPCRIRLAYHGAERLSLDREGNLRIHTAVGTLKDSRPMSFQLNAGERVPVASRYALADGTYGFALDNYDRSRPLVIDPLVAYSTYLGGGGNDQGLSVAFDSDGSAYVTGLTGLTSFPTTAGVFDTTSNGGGDAFVTKLSPDGRALVYSTYLGGGGNDQGNGIAVDSTGNAYVTGSTTSADFPVTPGAFDTSYNAATDGFVTKLDATGSFLVYSTYLGGSTAGVTCSPLPCPNDEGAGVAVDAAGSAYVTGGTRSRDFPVTSGAFDTSYTSGSGSHVFVTKLDAAGSALVYSTYLGGATGEAGAGIAVDAVGSAYVTGVTGSVGFPTTTGAFDTTRGGVEDAFVTKLNAEGSGLLYSTFLGGGGSDEGTGIAIDAAGNAYVSAWGNSADFPTTPGAFDASLSGGQDAYVAKLNDTGSALMYGTYLGGSSSENCWAIAVDAAGAAYVAGSTTSADFPVTTSAFDATYNSNSDVFLTKLNTGGSAPLYSTYFGGGSSDTGRGVAVDSSGSVYVTGTSTSNTFPVTQGAFDTTYNGGGDAFVIKLANQPPEANDDAAATDEDNAVNITVLSNDADPDGDPLTLDVTQGANGAVTINPDGTLTYSPAANFYGADSFTYTATDTFGKSDTATVNVTVNPVNDPPVAGDGSAATDEDAPVQITLAATDVDNSDLTFSVVSGPTNGTLGLVGGSGVTYTPNPNFNGSDSFTFKVSDGAADSNVATVSITVAPMNDPPDAVDDAASTDEDTPATIDVRANDTDADGDSLAVTAASTAAHGSVAVSADGTAVIYTPAPDFFGTDSFTYTVGDGGTADTATVSVTVTNVNDPPDAVDDSPAAINEDSGGNFIDVLANDTDPDDLSGPANAGLAVTAVTQGAHGSVTFTAGGVSYTPSANFYGSDSFTYTIGDGGGTTDTATVNISVTNVNDPPDAINDATTLAEDGGTNPVDVLANDTDADNLTPPANAGLGVSAVTQGAHGTVAITGGGTGVSYTPAPNFYGSDSFTYAVGDGNGGADAATVSVTVTNVNDEPAAGDDSYSTNADTTLAVPAPGVLGNDTDVDGDTLSAALVTGASNGTLALAADGSFSYTPNPGFSGADSFTYRASDGAANSNAATVQINVIPPTPGACKQEGQCFVFEYAGYATTPDGQTTITFKVTNKCKNVVRMVALGTDGFTRIAPADGSVYNGALGSYAVSWTRAGGNPGFVGIKFEPTSKNFKNGAADVFGITVSNFNPNTTIQVKGVGPTQETFSFLLSQTSCPAGMAGQGQGQAGGLRRWPHGLWDGLLPALSAFT